MNRPPKQPTPPKRADMNRLALDIGTLRVIIDKQMQALGRQGHGTSWLRWMRTDAWASLLKQTTAETQHRYELAWRTRYKKGVWKAWLAEQVQKNFLAKTTLRAIVSEAHLNFAGAWMCWAELHDDRPHAFCLLEPDPAGYGISLVDGEAVKLGLAMLPNWLWGNLVDGRPAMNTEPFVTVLDPLGLPIMTRWEKDIDVRDWQAVILEGLAPGWAIAEATDHQDLKCGPGGNLVQPGTIIGDGRGTIYQRGQGGNLVNLTKNPHALRTDLPGFKKPGQN